MYYSLISKTHKGKNKLREIADRCNLTKVEHIRWLELGRSNTVVFSDKQGPWLRLVPICADAEQTKFMRWVHLTEDENFEVIKTDDV